MLLAAYPMDEGSGKKIRDLIGGIGTGTFGINFRRFACYIIEKVHQQGLQVEQHRLLQFSFS